MMADFYFTGVARLKVGLATLLDFESLLYGLKKAAFPGMRQYKTRRIHETAFQSQTAG
ncbi:hypothetical protein Dthio_PD2252 [Desulfonatronospira thiodismutans ASO3-1]|uniref:Uncharacterized protein n=2 Tax=Desulfonatronospira thiodismutans TaxID=488939 RepID=D6SQ35_9BACT|nr:hypothetical protein [Desulfonatronospira sp. MSAO_Bac3]EFI34861.1 hypothetical protein Dthio_PD2252 [Desulfonatronospira thiodismutans ASO3-1]